MIARYLSSLPPQGGGLGSLSSLPPQGGGLGRGVFCLALIGCSPTPAPQATPPPSAPPAIEPAAPAAIASSAAPVDGAPCGELGCRSFSSPEAAFAAVLAGHPRVLAIGEAHAQAGDPQVASATKRFTDTLLPAVQGQASDLVLELTVPPARGCAPAQQKVESSVGEVTTSQAKSNKNEFVTLGEAADKLAIRPHVLRPSCDDLKVVASGGEDDIGKMLELIAKLTADLVHNILVRNERALADKMVLAYGGALHNDLAPRAGRESWSFGPLLRERAGGRYVELDLIVPEYIKDSDSWRGLEWYPHYRLAEHGQRTTLFQPRPGTFVLIFPRSR